MPEEETKKRQDFSIMVLSLRLDGYVLLSSASHDYEHNAEENTSVGYEGFERRLGLLSGSL